MNRKDVDRSKVTPMMQQYLDIKDENSDIILFFRLGDFYEMFFEDAYIASRELELTLTGKNAGLDERIPMCGIPYHAANVYIEKMVEKGYKIGICEQVEDPKQAKGIVKREVIQIISKGTLIDDESLTSYLNNYVGSILDFGHCYVISYADISTGEINAKMLPHNKNLLTSEIISLNIGEVILSDKVDKGVLSLLKNQFHLTTTVTDQISDLKGYEYIYNRLKILIKWSKLSKNEIKYYLQSWSIFKPNKDNI